MAYKIMIDEEYNTEGSIVESIPVEYDGILYDTRIEAWRAFWNSEDYYIARNYHVYVKEV